MDQEAAVRTVRGSKLGKECDKAAYYHSAYLTYMRVHHRKCQADETQAEIKIARRNINNLRYTDDTTLMAESEEELNSLLVKVKEESKKLAYSSTFRKLRSWHLVPSLHEK